MKTRVLRGQNRFGLSVWKRAASSCSALSIVPPATPNFFTSSKASA
jgi:hypothetical protein